MKTKFIMIIVCTAALIGAAGCYVSAGNSVKWFTYDKGMAFGKHQNKKIFITFYADWCSYCFKMDKDTFSDAAVSAYLNRNFIPIRVNFDKQPQVASRYGVRSLPSNWFVDENGDKISNLPGYISAERLMTILKYINTDSYKNQSYQRFLKTLKTS
jgi:thioredoxin-related protein